MSIRENLNFANNMFTFKLSAEAATARKQRRKGIYVPCSHCGSVRILSTSESISKHKDTGRSFCDNECANVWRKEYYRSDEYKAKVHWYRTALKEQDERTKANKLAERERIAKEKLNNSWRCCSWCGKAFNGKPASICCSGKCNRTLRTLVAITPAEMICVYCERKWLAGMPRHLTKYCSRRCESNAERQRREVWVRSNGPCEYIDLDKLIAKHRKKCCGCGCKVTKYNGSYRPTDASIDHVVPLSRGGWHAWSNVQLLCVDCNSRKADSIEQGTQLLLCLGGGECTMGV